MSVAERDLLRLAAVALLAMGSLLLLFSFLGASPLTAVWRWGRLTVVVPIGLSIVLSVVLTVLLNLLLRQR